MFNPTDLLGQMLQSGMSDSASDRLRHAMGPQGLGGADSPLGNLFANALGQGRGGAGGAMGGGLAEMAREFLGAGSSGASGTIGSNPLAVGGLGALAGALLGGGGGAAKGAIGGGAMALLGGLAMQALRNWGQGQTPGTEEVAKQAPLGLREPQGPAEVQELHSSAELMLKAMINAAKADQQVDKQELDRIVGKLGDAGADSEARTFVMSELSKPLDLDGLIRAVPNPQVGVQVYAASLLAIEVDTPAERQYMQQLAQGLGLDSAVVQRVHQALGIADA
jgi:uncharacterized membrane protein YebE (DUF533 family)